MSLFLGQKIAIKIHQQGYFNSIVHNLTYSQKQFYQKGNALSSTFTSQGMKSIIIFASWILPAD
jgi:hypothetical protein